MAISPFKTVDGKFCCNDGDGLPFEVVKSVTLTQTLLLLLLFETSTDVDGVDDDVVVGKISAETDPELDDEVLIVVDSEPSVVDEDDTNLLLAGADVDVAAVVEVASDLLAVVTVA